MAAATLVDFNTAIHPIAEATHSQWDPSKVFITAFDAALDHSDTGGATFSRETDGQRFRLAMAEFLTDVLGTTINDGQVQIQDVRGLPTSRRRHTVVAWRLLDVDDRQRQWCFTALGQPHSALERYLVANQLCAAISGTEPKPWPEGPETTAPQPVIDGIAERAAADSASNRSEAGESSQRGSVMGFDSDEHHLRREFLALRIKREEALARALGPRKVLPPPARPSIASLTGDRDLFGTPAHPGKGGPVALLETSLVPTTGTVPLALEDRLQALRSEQARVQDDAERRQTVSRHEERLFQVWKKKELAAVESERRRVEAAAQQTAEEGARREALQVETLRTLERSRDELLADVQSQRQLALDTLLLRQKLEVQEREEEITRLTKYANEQQGILQQHEEVAEMKRRLEEKKADIARAEYEGMTERLVLDRQLQLLKQRAVQSEVEVRAFEDGLAAQKAKRTAHWEDLKAEMLERHERVQAAVVQAAQDPLSQQRAETLAREMEHERATLEEFAAWKEQQDGGRLAALLAAPLPSVLLPDLRLALEEEGHRTLQHKAVAESLHRAVGRRDGGLLPPMGDEDVIPATAASFLPPPWMATGEGTPATVETTQPDSGEAGGLTTIPEEDGPSTAAPEFPSPGDADPVEDPKDGTDCSAAVSVRSEFGSPLNQDIAIASEERRLDTPTGVTVYDCQTLDKAPAMVPEKGQLEHKEACHRRMADREEESARRRFGDHAARERAPAMEADGRCAIEAIEASLFQPFTHAGLCVRSSLQKALLEHKEACYRRMADREEESARRRLRHHAVRQWIPTLEADGRRAIESIEASLFQPFTHAGLCVRSSLQKGQLEHKEACCRRMADRAEESARRRLGAHAARERVAVLEAEGRRCIEALEASLFQLFTHVGSCARSSLQHWQLEHKEACCRRIACVEEVAATRHLRSQAAKFKSVAELLRLQQKEACGRRVASMEEKSNQQRLDHQAARLWVSTLEAAVRGFIGSDEALWLRPLADGSLHLHAGMQRWQLESTEACYRLVACQEEESIRRHCGHLAARERVPALEITARRGIETDEMASRHPLSQAGLGVQSVLQIRHLEQKEAFYRRLAAREHGSSERILEHYEARLRVFCRETHHRNAIEAEEASLRQPFGDAGISLWQETAGRLAVRREEDACTCALECVAQRLRVTLEETFCRQAVRHSECIGSHGFPAMAASLTLTTEESVGRHALQHVESTGVQLLVIAFEETISRRAVEREFSVEVQSMLIAAEGKTLEAAEGVARAQFIQIEAKEWRHLFDHMSKAEHLYAKESHKRKSLHTAEGHDRLALGTAFSTTLGRAKEQEARRRDLREMESTFRRAIASDEGTHRGRLATVLRSLNRVTQRRIADCVEGAARCALEKQEAAARAPLLEAWAMLASVVQDTERARRLAHGLGTLEAEEAQSRFALDASEIATRSALQRGVSERLLVSRDAAEGRASIVAEEETEHAALFAAELPMRDEAEARRGRRELLGQVNGAEEAARRTAEDDESMSRRVLQNDERRGAQALKVLLGRMQELSEVEVAARREVASDEEERRGLLGAATEALHSLTKDLCYSPRSMSPRSPSPKRVFAHLEEEEVWQRQAVEIEERTASAGLLDSTVGMLAAVWAGQIGTLDMEEVLGRTAITGEQETSKEMLWHDASQHFSAQQIDEALRRCLLECVEDEANGRKVNASDERERRGILQDARASLDGIAKVMSRDRLEAMHRRCILNMERNGAASLVQAHSAVRRVIELKDKVRALEEVDRSAIDSEEANGQAQLEGAAAGWVRMVLSLRAMYEEDSALRGAIDAEEVAAHRFLWESHVVLKAKIQMTCLEAAEHTIRGSTLHEEAAAWGPIASAASLFALVQTAAQHNAARAAAAAEPPEEARQRAMTEAKEELARERLQQDVTERLAALREREAYLRVLRDTETSEEPGRNGIEADEGEDWSRLAEGLIALGTLQSARLLEAEEVAQRAHTETLHERGRADLETEMAIRQRAQQHKEHCDLLLQDTIQAQSVGRRTIDAEEAEQRLVLAAAMQTFRTIAEGRWALVAVEDAEGARRGALATKEAAGRSELEDLLAGLRRALEAAQDRVAQQVAAEQQARLEAEEARRQRGLAEALERERREVLDLHAEVRRLLDQQQTVSPQRVETERSGEWSATQEAVHAMHARLLQQEREADRQREAAEVQKDAGAQPHATLLQELTRAVQQMHQQMQQSEQTQKANQLRSEQDATFAARMKAEEEAFRATQLRIEHEARLTAQLRAEQEARTAAQLRAEQEAKVEAQLKDHEVRLKAQYQADHAATQAALARALRQIEEEAARSWHAPNPEENDPPDPEEYDALFSTMDRQMADMAAQLEDLKKMEARQDSRDQLQANAPDDAPLSELDISEQFGSLGRQHDASPGSFKPLAPQPSPIAAIPTVDESVAQQLHGELQRQRAVGAAVEQQLAQAQRTLRDAAYERQRQLKVREIEVASRLKDAATPDEQRAILVAHRSRLVAEERRLLAQLQAIGDASPDDTEDPRPHGISNLDHLKWLQVARRLPPESTRIAWGSPQMRGVPLPAVRLPRIPRARPRPPAHSDDRWAKGRTVAHPDPLPRDASRAMRSKTQPPRQRQEASPSASMDNMSESLQYHDWLNSPSSRASRLQPLPSTGRFPESSPSTRKPFSVAPEFEHESLYEPMSSPLALSAIQDLRHRAAQLAQLKSLPRLPGGRIHS